MKIIDALWNHLMLVRKRVRHGRDLQLNGRVHLHGRKGGIVIGDHCKITSDGDYNPTAGGPYTHLSVGPEGELVIGNNVGMSLVHITAHRSVVIDDNVMLGAGVKIWDTDFHAIDYEARMRDEAPAVKPIHIEEGVFVGACAIILKGVTIGRHAVIGAGAVVTKDVPAGEIWAGNPARCIRKAGE